MNFSDKLLMIRKSQGMTQESLAEALQVSRQAVTKWESGLAYPDILNLIQLSDLFHVTVDYLVKDNPCGASLEHGGGSDLERLIAFRLEANRKTYAANAQECASSRPLSHDYRYEKDGYLYYDTWLGGECFAGEEALWHSGNAVYAMNYFGRVLDEKFSGDFLKAALRAAELKMPYRGPEYFQAGEYIYKTSVVGGFEWFQGYEEIFCRDTKVYECYYHGGLLRQ